MFNIYLTTMNFMKKITDLVVNAITLVPSEETPAVEKAETKFSIFKTLKKSKLTKAQKEAFKKIAEK